VPSPLTEQVNVLPEDRRRAVPSTDALLADSRLLEPQQRLGRSLVRSVLRESQRRVRAGKLAPSAIVDTVLQNLPRYATTLTPVINATGVVLHTNLGRAALSTAARDAVAAAAGYVDIEFDLVSGSRADRGRGALAALHASLPDAADVLVVNNGAAALLLAITVLVQDQEIVMSRGEMLEIGDGFRLHDLVACTGARLHEVGTTNRTTRDDYVSAIGEHTGCILKVHPSNFRIAGFTAAVPLADLIGLGPPVIADLGSGLLKRDPLLPDEPDMTSALRAGADVVTSSGDKLLGGPQAGLIAGRGDLIARMRRHPLARALRVDKLRLAALEATLSGPPDPTQVALHADSRALNARALAIAARVNGDAGVVPSNAEVGGGSAPGLVLASWAISLPEPLAAPLRTGRPAVVGRLERGRLLLDLRCIPPEEDEALVVAVNACM
jgi:L-seryl-tRNA(Ser) seleniumtransferase